MKYIQNIKCGNIFPATSDGLRAACDEAIELYNIDNPNNTMTFWDYYRIIEGWEISPLAFFKNFCYNNDRKKEKELIQMANVIKKIDDVGRVAIPKEMRRALRWMGGDEIEIIQKDNQITLRKYQPNISGQLTDTKDAFQEWIASNGIQNNSLMEQFQQLIEKVQEQEDKIGG